mmetsp:Transcript_34353/g.74990  ORF Transcript_34353/g.74990 Transcript_34353/m.74990 type:complete len:83 (+) Transcript_34353:1032-1280(+)
MIKEAMKRKQEEAERKAFEKKRKEIEKLRKAKLNLIKARMENCEAKEVDSVNVWDINDKNPGLYCIGGSLGELILSLLAYSE